MRKKLHRLHTHLKDALGDLWLPLVRLIPRVLDVFGGESPFLADDGLFFVAVVYIKTKLVFYMTRLFADVRFYRRKSIVFTGW